MFFTQPFLVNIVLQDSKVGIISIKFKNITKLENYKATKIGETIIEYYGITAYGILDGLGMNEVRGKVSSIFIGVEEGECYDKIIELFNENYYKLNNFTA